MNDHYRGKRVLDLVVLAILCIPASVIGLLCSLAIRCDSRGPISFRQVRVGYRGRTFVLLKFRSMFDDASRPMGFPREADITRVGWMLRRFSLDELPQLVNIFRGDMSIVGPRPTLPYQVERYSEEERERLQVRPGLIGLAQVEGRNEILWAERIKLDREYIEKQSLRLDVSIILRSVPYVLRGSGHRGHPQDDPIARLDQES